MKLSTNASSQRMRIIEALRIQPMTTLEIRAQLDVLEVGSRVCELRNQYGYDIASERIEMETAQGVKHRVARYSLISEAGAGL